MNEKVPLILKLKATTSMLLHYFASHTHQSFMDEYPNYSMFSDR